jgi:hypothetical protein
LHLKGDTNCGIKMVANGKGMPGINMFQGINPYFSLNAHANINATDTGKFVVFNNPQGGFHFKPKGISNIKCGLVVDDTGRVIVGDTLFRTIFSGSEKMVINGDLKLTGGYYAPGYNNVIVFRDKGDQNTTGFLASQSITGSELLEILIGVGALALVTGKSKQNNDNFCDLIFFSGNATDIIYSKTIGGSPPPRTYYTGAMMVGDGTISYEIKIIMLCAGEW